jgi:transcriptional regulator with XRE-family HTH domain
MEHNPHRIIGENLHRIRRNRELSLDGLADITGVSKSMLRQIERGESSPTIATLWKIADNLQIPLGELLHEPQRPVTVVAKRELIPISDDPEHYQLYTLFPFDPSKKFEIFTMDLRPGCEKHSEPHQEGVEEYILVSQGELTLDVGEECYDIAEGNAIHFAANQSHVLRNCTKQPTVIIIIINYYQKL